MCAWRGSLLWVVLYTDDSRGCSGGGQGGEEEEGRLRMCTHTLTLEVAFPFKSPIPLRYAELMQDLLRQWGNTAELCSLCCQQACKEEEGERARRGGGGGVRERERKRESANNVILFRRQCCSQLCRAMKAHHQRPWGSEWVPRSFPSSPARVRCGPTLICRYTCISSPVFFTLHVVSLSLSICIGRYTS